jgi:hypothetical protein
MTFRTLLVVKAVVCLAFGTFLLVAPSILLGLLGTNLGAGGMFTGREYGAALIGAFLLMWFARDIKAPDARGAILLYLLVYDAIAMVVTLKVVVSSVLNSLGWGIVAVYGFFTVASGCFLIREKPFRRVNTKDGT